ncbi:MAG TPA: DUF2934 domain-containing protein [Kofleriaceae bacterium]|nr:DUF2934 domain-containing protein [Kofleriaceae bacterium]
MGTNSRKDRKGSKVVVVAATTEHLPERSDMRRKGTVAGATARGVGEPRSPLPPPGFTPEQRQQRIAELAYQLAEQRGFAPGGEVDDWLAAERMIDGAPGSR